MNNPLTTSTMPGVITRYGIVIIGTMLTVVGFLGWLDDTQIETLKASTPAFIEALGAIVTIATASYAVISKSSSDKAKAVADAVDKGVKEGELAKSGPVEIKTPNDAAPNIIVPAPK
jgi:hypothetical protein